MPCARRSRRFACSAVSVIVALALAASPAAAASCPPGPTSKPFTRWLDPAAYVLAPGGAAEATGAWTLQGGAAVVAGNEPFRVGAPTDRASLRLPSGSSATTAAMCIGIEHPTMRFFARRESGSPLDALLVEALYSDPEGHGHALPIGAVMSLGSWAPTLPLLLGVNLLALSGDPLQVSFRFTPRNQSRWSIDDVYVDPYRTN